MFRPIHPRRPGMTVVYRAAGLVEAEIIKGRLEGASIPVMLDYESAGPAIGITVNGLGEVRVLVPNQHAQEAKELIEPREGDEQLTDEA